MGNSLPKGWVDAKLGSICSKAQYGWTSKAGGKGEVKYLRTTDISDGTLNWDSVPYCLEVPQNSEKYQIRKNDILVSRAGSVGLSFRITDDVKYKAVFASYLIRFKAYHSLTAKYVDYFLKSNDYWNQINEFTAGIAIPNVNASKLEDLAIPFPPLAEQQRIVTKLDAVLARVNNCRNRLKKIPALLKNFRQSVLAAAISGELTKEWREQNKPFSVSSYSEFTSDAFIGNDGLPEEWSWMSIEDYLLNLDSNRVPISQEIRSKRQGEYPYYGATGIIDSIDDYTHDGEFILISEDGKNLQFRNKPICFLAAGKIWVNNHAHVLQVKTGFQNRYVVYFINVTDLNPFLTGIDQVKLSQKNLNEILVPVPPKEEQKEIVRIVEKLFRFADSIEARYQKAKAWFDKVPQAILAKAFRGELVSQDENDEPASVLLERIRQEKDKATKPASKRRRLYEQEDVVSKVAEGEAFKGLNR